MDKLKRITKTTKVKLVVGDAAVIVFEFIVAIPAEKWFDISSVHGS